ncbi:hypothetical protein [Clostridium estertheticum]|nr:hypothetical protein [Clostridium estertheticum]
MNFFVPMYYDVDDEADMSDTFRQDRRGTVYDSSAIVSSCWLLI